MRFDRPFWYGFLASSLLLMMVALTVQHEIRPSPIPQPYLDSIQCGVWNCVSPECERAHQACRKGGVSRISKTLREMDRRLDGGSR